MKMIISISEKNAKIKYGQETFTYPLNSISYTVDDQYTGLTLFRNNERIGTSPVSQVVVDGEELTPQNLDQLLLPLFSKQQESIILPIEITDVNGLQDELDAKTEDWSGTTLYVDGTYEGSNSTGSPLKPFKTIQAAHDAFVPINDYDSVRIVYSPSAYGFRGEEEVIFTKNVTLWGPEDTQQYDVLLGKIIIKEGCNQCHMERVQMLGLEVDNINCSLTCNNIYVYEQEILLTNADYVDFNVKRANSGQVIKMINCKTLNVCNSNSLMVEQNSGSFCATDCMFGWINDTDNIEKNAFVFNAGVVASFVNCTFAFHLYALNRWGYHKVVNNANKPIVFFGGLIGDEIKAVRNVRYSSRNVEYTPEGDINMIGKRNIILDKNKEILGVAYDDSQHNLVKMGDYNISKNLKDIKVGDELTGLIAHFPVFVGMGPVSGIFTWIFSCEKDGIRKSLIFNQTVTDAVIHIYDESLGYSTQNIYDVNSGGWLISDVDLSELGVVVAIGGEPSDEMKYISDNTTVDGIVDQWEFGSESIHLNLNSNDRPSIETKSGKNLLAYTSDISEFESKIVKNFDNNENGVQINSDQYIFNTANSSDGSLSSTANLYYGNIALAGISPYGSSHIHMSPANMNMSVNEELNDGRNGTTSISMSGSSGLNISSSISGEKIRPKIDDDDIVVSETPNLKLKVLTQAEYDALSVKDENTIYFIKE